jgi:hypothetical protein
MPAASPVRSEYTGYNMETVNENVGLVLNEEKKLRGGKKTFFV